MASVLVGLGLYSLIWSQN